MLPSKQWICGTCFNSAWQPCSVNDPEAIQSESGFEKCEYCALEKAYRELQAAFCLRGEDPETITPQRVRETLQLMYDLLGSKTGMFQ